MSKTAKKAKKPVINPENPEAAEKLSDVFLGKACRSTVYIREHKNQNDFSSALRHEAMRNAWLQASLIAKERGL